MNKLCVRQYCPFFCRITIFHQVESMFLLDSDEVCTLSHDGCKGKGDLQK